MNGSFAVWRERLAVPCPDVNTIKPNRRRISSTGFVAARDTKCPSFSSNFVVARPSSRHALPGTRYDHGASDRRRTAPTVKSYAFFTVLGGAPIPFVYDVVRRRAPRAYIENNTTDDDAYNTRGLANRKYHVRCNIPYAWAVRRVESRWTLRRTPRVIIIITEKKPEETPRGYNINNIRATSSIIARLI